MALSPTFVLCWLHVWTCLVSWMTISLLVNVYFLVMLVLYVWTSIQSFVGSLLYTCIFISYLCLIQLLLIHWMYSLYVFETYNQTHINKTLNPSLNWVLLLRLCWHVSLALETVSDTNIFGAVAGDEAEANLPWDTYHFPGLSGGIKPASWRLYFHQVWQSGC